MKRTIVLLTAAILALTLAACGNQTTPSASDDAEESATQEQAAQSVDTQETTDETTQTAEEANVLVVYFSATGTTKSVAEKIATLNGADTYEIVAAEPYSDADLNWHDSSSRTTLEQDDKSVRPAIEGEALSLNGYDTIYVGYPIWWGEEPRILDTFVESYDFSGKIVIPFCTSTSSGIGRSGSNLAELAGSGTWLDGARFGGGVSEDDVQAWLDSLQ